MDTRLITLFEVEVGKGKSRGLPKTLKAYSQNVYLHNNPIYTNVG